MRKGSVHCDTQGITWGTTSVPSPTSGPRLQSSPPRPPSVGDSGLGGGLLTCEASVDLVVARPEPQNSAVKAPHPVHGGSSHLLEVASAVLAAKEEAHVAPDGLEDFLGLGYGGEERPFAGASQAARPCRSPLHKDSIPRPIR